MLLRTSRTGSSQTHHHHVSVPEGTSGCCAVCVPPFWGSSQTSPALSTGLVSLHPPGWTSDKYCRWWHSFGNYFGVRARSGLLHCIYTGNNQFFQFSQTCTHLHPLVKRNTVRIKVFCPRRQHNDPGQDLNLDCIRPSHLPKPKAKSAHEWSGPHRQSLSRFP